MPQQEVTAETLEKSRQSVAAASQELAQATAAAGYVSPAEAKEIEEQANAKLQAAIAAQKEVIAGQGLK